MVAKKRKVWLTKPQVDRILELAKADGEGPYLLLSLMRYGLRVGEITGERGLPGIDVSDLRPLGIWVKGKGFARGIVQDRLVSMPPVLMEAIRTFAPKRGSLFGLSCRTAENMVKEYARRAGVEDWQLVSPHRLRAFFATDLKDRGKDAFTIRDLMRHKNITTTNLYVGVTSPEQASKIMESLT